MEIITKDQFESAIQLRPSLKEGMEIKELNPEEMDKMLIEMNNPVNFQKELAVKVKVALDHQISFEMKNKGVLSDHTRRWVESYNKILEKIQSALHGDKSVSLHIHRVSHGDIAARIRDSK